MKLGINAKARRRKGASPASGSVDWSFARSAPRRLCVVASRAGGGCNSQSDNGSMSPCVAGGTSRLKGHGYDDANSGCRGSTCRRGCPGGPGTAGSAGRSEDRRQSSQPGAAEPVVGDAVKRRDISASRRFRIKEQAHRCNRSTRLRQRPRYGRTLLGTRAASAPVSGRGTMRPSSAER